MSEREIQDRLGLLRPMGHGVPWLGASVNAPGEQADSPSAMEALRLVTGEQEVSEHDQERGDNENDAHDGDEDDPGSEGWIFFEESFQGATHGDSCENGGTVRAGKAESPQCEGITCHGSRRDR